MFKGLFGSRKKSNLIGIFPLWMMILGALFAIGGVAVLACLAITEFGKHGIVADLMILAAVFASIITARAAFKDEEPYKSGYSGKKKKKKKEAPTRSWNDYLEKYSELPHFEWKLDKEKVMSIINNAPFSPYMTRSGVALNNVLISDDDKWVCILGGYIPVDLICGYNAEKNVIYSIDDHEIELPKEAKDSEISMDLNTFFDDRGIFYTSMPEDAYSKYIDSTEMKFTHLDEADFSRVRYKWEKAVADMNSNKKGSKYQPVLEDGAISQDIFERVLSSKEIKKTESAIHKKEVKLSEYLDFKAYKNEFSVCNTIALLKKLEYPKNEEGLDFLFRCLRDVDEAYFLPAIDVIMKFPGRKIQAMLEENAERAYESMDVVGLAGLMYLAKKMQYKIRYVEEIRLNQAVAANQKADVQKQQTAEQSFATGGMAYQEQI